ncbi:CRISPR-associated protein Cas4 [Clostridium sporogenes]|uniref:CRISPR-associated protein Cas4 n=1 Tax=Clostridium TaxID=1485 RepID=UPI000D11EAA8|nr:MULTISPECIES: CRISPR-associated protein Cas4 [Clostridium]AVQ46548.1 CRISPR-associated protein Cas4 [Clostridium botulinum]AVQ50154.1 CRISPR-associated protein Cas4 [Clostridium botulinum]EJE7235990.1 CRISPR-associated protein Cas4 [Clostridium botulinum]MBE6057708.1 CRISPR-associated protein Cas4 [Clostridium sp.]NFQ02142.1 CRISPR-associated protein Cas4 [Clostridium sporogenes]
MKVNGTLINYYFHCKRQCWLHGNRINLEDNSKDVKIGKAIHEVKSEKSKQTEISIDNIKIDKLTKDYLTEIKKSDADIEAAKWQVLLYLKVLKDKGIERKGKLQFIEKNKSKNTIIIELDKENLEELNKIIKNIKNLLLEENPPEIINEPKCKKCAYFEYCYI